jgi:hypothetical protein
VWNVIPPGEEVAVPEATFDVSVIEYRQCAEKKLVTFPVQSRFPADKNVQRIKLQSVYQAINALVQAATQLQALVRQICAARMSAFHQLTFDWMVLEAGRLAKTEDLISSQITIESDPGYVVSIRRTGVVDDGCPKPPIGNTGELSARHTVFQDSL